MVSLSAEGDIPGCYSMQNSTQNPNSCQDKRLQLSSFNAPLYPKTVRWSRHTFLVSLLFDQCELGPVLRRKAQLQDLGFLGFLRLAKEQRTLLSAGCSVRLRRCRCACFVTEVCVDMLASEHVGKWGYWELGILGRRCGLNVCVRARVCATQGVCEDIGMLVGGWVRCARTRASAWDGWTAGCVRLC